MGRSRVALGLLRVAEQERYYVLQLAHLCRNGQNTYSEQENDRMVLDTNDGGWFLVLCIEECNLKARTWVEPYQTLVNTKECPYVDSSKRERL